MKAFLSGLTAYLRSQQDYIVAHQDVRCEVYDPTYGLRESTISVSSLDFDALLRAIDEFAETFDGDKS